MTSTVHVDLLEALFCPWIHVTQIWRATFWMAHYDSATPKGHAIYSNSPAISMFDLGKLRRKARGLPGSRTTVRYRNRHGQRRFTGTSQLKQTEMLGGFAVVSTSLAVVMISGATICILYIHQAVDVFELTKNDSLQGHNDKPRTRTLYTKGSSDPRSNPTESLYMNPYRCIYIYKHCKYIHISICIYITYK